MNKDNVSGREQDENRQDENRKKEKTSGEEIQKEEDIQKEEKPQQEWESLLEDETSEQEERVMVDKIEVVEETNEGTSAARIFKIVNGSLECLWGFPFIGGTIIMSLLWTPLVLMFILHIVCLVLAIQEDKTIRGPLIGVIGNAVGWIPFVGMVMHILAAVFNLVEGINDQ